MNMTTLLKASVKKAPWTTIPISSSLSSKVEDNRGLKSFLPRSVVRAAEEESKMCCSCFVPAACA